METREQINYFELLKVIYTGKSSVSYGIPWPSQCMEFKVHSTASPNFFCDELLKYKCFSEHKIFNLWLLFSTGQIKI